ncbi:four-carbon acid sugar kinase family protein [Lutimaribacter sp. EGI FJ00015]|uniref:Four-carbon acid sugar kinase family protein n=1 Tax=Lutimaribacter degradans TaxID=2945989 RepID=A0ACC5ZUR2_9RHOB|nr:3-oxo-tetronate kinase [Lutimaribacter sp. EGI FJ00013]MCM2562084.1 four-carbon acid sugar kinase family protein [Lutimaribacter sp. EGI FJ00013]MCO0613237.1 four-carbon acid sugar kinase family protein [Lutimaribacter sp. EGI FJ00015]MCO0636214.1 four-carbon acid sugar kinase family protein [Lutimaribacter sp. EGI FJ00014]
MLLGCIGDDFTGSSDLGNTLAKAGMRTVQYVGTPDEPAPAQVEAGIVALKSRSIPVQDAISQSLAALDWLRAQGCRQFLFKYCSTFDSTPEGNIGPVAEALAAALDARQVIVCPAFPATGRSIYLGHLFVWDRLLNESGMQHHPLTPMTDPDIRRWLSRQARGSIGHVDAAVVRQGAVAIRRALADEDSRGHRLIVTDAIVDDDLMALGQAAAELPLITGGSGIAMGLPENFRARGELAGCAVPWRGQAGPAVILSGSCSAATREQVDRHAARHPARALDVGAIMAGDLDVAEYARWALAQDGIPLIYSSADPAQVSATQERFGRERTATAIEAFFCDLAGALVQHGCTRLISAGGETSGAVVTGLNLAHLEIGPEIAPGVPVMRAGDNLVLALKSGNFGEVDFFAAAARVMERSS